MPETAADMIIHHQSDSSRTFLVLVSYILTLRKWFNMPRIYTRSRSQYVVANAKGEWHKSGSSITYW